MSGGKTRSPLDVLWPLTVADSIQENSESCSTNLPWPLAANHALELFLGR